LKSGTESEKSLPEKDKKPKAMPDNLDGGDRVRSLSKGLRIITLFGVNRPELSLKEIVSFTKFPQPTAYRLVKTLEDQLYLVFDPGTGKYSIGPALIPALYLLDDHKALIRVLRPHLEELAEAAGEHSSLSVAVDTWAVVIDAVDSRRSPFHLNLSVGRVQDRLRSAHHKVIAAFSEDDYLARLGARTDYRIGPDTASGTSPATDDALAKVRSEGLAWDFEGLIPGVCAVASPVRDGSGSVLASIALVVPKERFTSDRLETLAGLVRTYGERMSRELGYMPGTSE